MSGIRIFVIWIFFTCINFLIKAGIHYQLPLINVQNFGNQLSRITNMVGLISNKLKMDHGTSNDLNIDDALIKIFYQKLF